MSMGTPTVRPAAVAGKFYPGDPKKLAASVRSYMVADQQPEMVLGCVVPHAGYMYSGHVAGAVYARVRVSRRCIVLCPNHTGLGTPLSMMTRGAWQTPLGDVGIDVELADALMQEFPLLTDESLAHRTEHAIEVQLPFLQTLRSGIRFVPIALGTRQFDVLEGLGFAIADVLSGIDEPVLVIASSDMNHYESDPVTRVKDEKAIEQILALDARGLYDVVMQEEVSMCGFGPTIAMLTAARQRGATQGDLVKYATSGDVSGDRQMVVGYAGIVVS
jgi:AmmeMemoRadiSam system protein B